ncbi:MAG: hypothetical protein ACRCZ9_03775 [Fusobacteriaceae bacterium]
MKTKIKESSIDNELLKKIVSKYIKYKNRNKIVKNYINIFDNKEILNQDIKFLTTVSPENHFYGHISNLKEYSKFEDESYSTIEHSFIFGDAVSEFRKEDKMPKMIVFSDYRKEVISKFFNEIKKSKEIIPIGPYIHYAKNYLEDKEFYDTKKKLGKTLLVFPSHTIENINLDYDRDLFIRQIKKLSKNYQSVLICMYWKDLLNGENILYEKNGFKVVTAGKREDPKFLNRLKTFIKLSDFTMSNKLGAYIPYSIYLKKPHFLFDQESVFQSESVNLNLEKGFLITDKENHQIKEVYRILGNENGEVSEKDYIYLSDIFGFKDIKTSLELYNILK